MDHENTSRMKRTWLWAAALMLLALCGGCAPPQIVVAQGFAGQHVVRYTIQNSGQTQNDEALFNLGARICTQGEDGSDQNCKDSLLLENVKPRSIY